MCHCFFLVIGYSLFLWSLEFGQLVIVLRSLMPYRMRSGYNDGRSQPRSGTGVLTVQDRCYYSSGVGGRDYPGQQWVPGKSRNISAFVLFPEPGTSHLEPLFIDT